MSGWSVRRRARGDLDVAIFAAVEPKLYARSRNAGTAFSPKGLDGEALEARILSNLKRVAPKYTTSLDAALTLVPFDAEGKRLHVELEINVYNHARVDMGINWWARHENAPSAALALCIAALRARAPSQDGDQ